MTEIQPIQSQQTIHSGLTNEDITRMPKAYVHNPNELQADVFEPQKESHTMRKTILTLLVAGAAIVGLKHVPFLKYDANATGFINKFIKYPLNKVGGWLEFPFKKLYGIFKSKDVEKGAGEGIDETAKGARKGFKRITGWFSDGWKWLVKKFTKTKPAETTT